MEEIDSIYDLEESDSSFIAEKIKKLDDSEESFDSFKKELSVFWSSKNKEAKAKQEEAIAKRVQEEVEQKIKNQEKPNESLAKELDVEKALDSAEAEETSIPNNVESQASKQSLKDQFRAAFSRENILK